MADPILPEESPVKHTSGGEMPDPSMVSALTRRFRAAIPILDDKLREVPVPIVVGAIVLFGGFLLWRALKA